MINIDCFSKDEDELMQSMIDCMGWQGMSWADIEAGLMQSITETIAKCD